MGQYLEKLASPAVLNHAWRLLRDPKTVEDLRAIADKAALYSLLTSETKPDAA